MLDVEAFRKIVEKSAFHQLIGLRLEKADAEAGIAVLRLPYRPELSIFPDSGVIHGGVLGALIDVAGAVACGLTIGRPTPTANFRVDFLKSPAKIELIATGRLVRSGRTVAIADIEITDDSGEVYAIGRGTFSTAAAFKAIPGGRRSGEDRIGMCP